MFLFGTGYKSSNQKISQEKENGYPCIQNDETAIKVGSELIWLWVVIEPIDKEILSFDISKERNMFVVAERFLSNVINEYGKHPVSTDGGTWYPQACKFLKLNHHIHSFVYKDEKSIIERTMQYIKDRTENLMTTFLVKRTNVN